MGEQSEFKFFKVKTANWFLLASSIDIHAVVAGINRLTELNLLELLQLS